MAGVSASISQLPLFGGGRGEFGVVIGLVGGGRGEFGGVVIGLVGGGRGEFGGVVIGVVGGGRGEFGGVVIGLVGGGRGEFGAVVIGPVGCKLVIEVVHVAGSELQLESELRDVGRISDSVHCFDDVSIFFFSITRTPNDVTFGSDDNAMRWKLFALFGSKNMLGA